MAPAVVLLHGFTHTRASWGPVIAELGKRYRPLAPDIRGHGEAADRVPVSLRGVIEDVALLAPQRFTLVGYSMGGRLALHAGLALPERVERLILIGASPGIEDPREREARVQADERLACEMEASTIEEIAERWAGSTPVLAGQPEDVREAARRDRLRNTPAGLAGALRGLGTGAVPPLWGRLGELAMPVDLVVGERDGKFREMAGRMAPRIPAVQIHTVAGAGHAVHLEAPAQVAAIVERRRGRGT